MNHALYSLVLAPFGIVLLVAGSFVPCRVVDEVLSHGGSLSRRYFQSGFVIMKRDPCPAT